MKHPVHAGSGGKTGAEIANIAFDEFGSRGHVFTPAIDQAVQHPHFITARQQFFREMAADESGAAGDQNVFHGPFLYRFWKKARSSLVLMPRASVASATSSRVMVQPCAARWGRKGRKLISPVALPFSPVPARKSSQADLRPSVPSREVPTSEKPSGVVISPSRVCNTLVSRAPSKTYST